MVANIFLARITKQILGVISRGVGDVFISAEQLDLASELLDAMARLDTTSSRTADTP